MAPAMAALPAPAAGAAAPGAPRLLTLATLFDAYAVCITHTSVAIALLLIMVRWAHLLDISQEHRPFNLNAISSQRCTALPVIIDEMP